MFVRIKTSPKSPKKAVQIVESIRQGNRVKQRIVRHVGTAFDEDELKSMQELAEHIKARMEQGTQPRIISTGSHCRDSYSGPQQANRRATTG